MDKDNEVHKVKNLSEIVQSDKTSKAGCSHYKRKAKFVVRINQGRSEKIGKHLGCANYVVAMKIANIRK